MSSEFGMFLSKKNEQSPDLTEKEQATIASYDRMAKPWTEQHAISTFWQDELITMQALLPAGSKVLEVGPGGGREATILGKTFDYTGVDLSQGLLAIARTNNPDLRFQEGSVYALPFDENNFDGFWLAAVLFHIPKDRIQQALGDLHRVTRNNGIGFISIKKGSDERIIAKERFPGILDERFFAYYSPEEFTQQLASAGFSVLSMTERSFTDKSGNTSWLSFFIQCNK